MKKLVSQYVEQHIGIFHQKRIKSLDTLKLSTVIRRKNPYLFKAKYVLTAEQIIISLMEAHISSNEETLFGDWLEGLAIFINNKVFGGHKSGIRSIDLEFDNDDGVRNIVTIKSGPNWGNSSQIAKMIADFGTAKKTLRTSNSKLQIAAVNGCCYGSDNKPDKGSYFKFCGQRFWEFISGNNELFTEIIESIGYKSQENNDIDLKSYSQMVSKFTGEFANDYCKSNGEINWDKLVRFNSA